MCMVCAGEGGGGGSEPGQWRNWMEEKLKGGCNECWMHRGERI